MNDPIAVSRLAALLRETETAHGTYQAQQLGGAYDEHWPEWYAKFMLLRMEQDLASAGMRRQHSRPVANTV